MSLSTELWDTLPAQGGHHPASLQASVFALDIFWPGYLAPFALSLRLHDLTLLVNVYMHTIPKGRVVLPLLQKHVCCGPCSHLCLAAEPLQGFPLPAIGGFRTQTPL